MIQIMLGSRLNTVGFRPSLVGFALLFLAAARFIHRLTRDKAR